VINNSTFACCPDFSNCRAISIKIVKGIELYAPFKYTAIKKKLFVRSIKPEFFNLLKKLTLMTDAINQKQLRIYSDEYFSGY